jgi:hypothetical protein
MAEMKKLFIAFIAALLTLSFCTGCADPITAPEESFMPPPIPTISQEDLFKITDTVTMDINIPDGLLVPKGQLALNCNFGWINFELAREKGLMGERNLVTGDYLTLQAIYKKEFYEYLSETIDFKKYEDMLNPDGLFSPAYTDKTNAYQRFGSYGNEFLFLRNRFYIEKLSVEDLLSLATGTELRELVVRTYKEIISDPWTDPFPPIITSPYADIIYSLPRFDIYFDERSYREIAQNSIRINYDIELGIRYDDRPLNGFINQNKDEYLSNEGYKARRDYMNELRYKIQNEIALLLDYPIAIFVFNGAYDDDLGVYWDPAGPPPDPGSTIELW